MPTHKRMRCRFEMRCRIRTVLELRSAVEGQVLHTHNSTLGQSHNSALRSLSYERGARCPLQKILGQPNLKTALSRGGGEVFLQRTSAEAILLIAVIHYTWPGALNTAMEKQQWIWLFTARIASSLGFTMNTIRGKGWRLYLKAT